MLATDTQSRPTWMHPTGVPGQILADWTKIMKALGPIAKDSEAEDAAYKYRSIDAVVSELNPLLVKHKVVSTIETSQVQRGRLPRRGAPSLSSVQVHVTLRFIARDGTWLELKADGEAYDASDKGVAKATTSAVKTALLHGMMVPVGDPKRDPDAYSPDPNAGPTLSPQGQTVTEQLDAAPSARAVAELMRSGAYESLSGTEAQSIGQQAVKRWLRLLKDENAPKGPVGAPIDITADTRPLAASNDAPKGSIWAGCEPSPNQVTACMARDAKLEAELEAKDQASAAEPDDDWTPRIGDTGKHGHWHTWTKTHGGQWKWRGEWARGFERRYVQTSNGVNFWIEGKKQKQARGDVVEALEAALAWAWTPEGAQ